MATFTCTTKGCMKTTQDSLLDESTNEIICCECGNPINNITEFTKRSMKGMGKVLKAQSKSAFVVDCPKCQRKGQPIMKEDNPCCYNCGQVLKLTKPFVQAFKEYLKKPSNG